MESFVRTINFRTPRELTDEEAANLESMIGEYFNFLKFEAWDVEVEHHYASCPLCDNGVAKECNNCGYKTVLYPKKFG